MDALYTFVDVLCTFIKELCTSVGFCVLSLNIALLMLRQVAMPSAPHTALSSDSCFAIASSPSGLCTLGRVVLPYGTAHRPDGRLLLHHLPERFAVRGFLCTFDKDYSTSVRYCTANVEEIVFLVEEQVPMVAFSPHHSPDGIMVGLADW